MSQEVLTQKARNIGIGNRESDVGDCECTEFDRCSKLAKNSSGTSDAVDFGQLRFVQLVENFSIEVRSR